MALRKKKKNRKDKAQEATEETLHGQSESECVRCACISIFVYSVWVSVCICDEGSNRQTHQREEEERGYCWKA